MTAIAALLLVSVAPISSLYMVSSILLGVLSFGLLIHSVKIHSSLSGTLSFLLLIMGHTFMQDIVFQHDLLTMLAAELVSLTTCFALIVWLSDWLLSLNLNPRLTRRNGNPA